jgi:hypothetical protein
MPVPASGPLSLRGIRAEVTYSDYTQLSSIVNISLSDVSTGVNGTLNTSSLRPDSNTPHKMSEWRGYDHDYSATTAPSVSTGICSWDNVNSNINALGSVSSDGGATITERGFCYSTTDPPTTSSGKTTVSGTTGTLSANLPAIQFSSSYNMYVRAYAINSVGTSYGVTRAVTVPLVRGGIGFNP